MKPSTEKIYNLLQTKLTANQVADIMGWKVESVRRTIHDLMQEKMVMRFEDGYISTYAKDEISIKAHNPFNL